MHGDDDRIQTKVATLAAPSDDGASVAAAALSAWREVDACLSPVIGKQGMYALIKRSIHLSSDSFPWLSAAFYSGGVDSAALLALHDELSKQPGADAAAANRLVLQTFSDLLSTLIGSALTERIMEPTLRAPPGGPILQNPVK